MLKYSLVFIVFLIGCKTSKNVSIQKIDSVVVTKQAEKIDWIRTENKITKTDGSAEIEFEGITEVFISNDGNISIKGDKPKISTKTSRIEEIQAKDSIHAENEVIQDVKVSKTEKTIQKEKTRFPFWIFILLGLIAVAVFVFRRF